MTAELEQKTEQKSESLPQEKKKDDSVVEEKKEEEKDGVAEESEVKEAVMKERQTEETVKPNETKPRGGNARGRGRDRQRERNLDPQVVPRNPRYFAHDIRGVEVYVFEIHTDSVEKKLLPFASHARRRAMESGNTIDSIFPLLPPSVGRVKRNVRERRQSACLLVEMNLLKI